MTDLNELQALTNSPCILTSEETGKEYKCSFPDIEQLVLLQGQVKTDLLESTRNIALAMSQSGASQEMVDEVWKDYQSEDDKKSLKNLFLDPKMLEKLIKACLVKNHPDITDKELKEVLTVPNLAKVTGFFENLKSIIDIKETAEKN